MLRENLRIPELSNSRELKHKPLIRKDVFAAPAESAPLIMPAAVRLSIELKIMVAALRAKPL